MSKTRGKADVKLEDPPATSFGRYDWATIAAKVKKHPNRWHNVFKGDRVSLATSIRGGSVVALLPSKGFVVRTANNKPATDTDPRTCDLYLMYVPDNDHDRK